MTCITVLGRMLEAVVIGSMAQLVLNVNRSAVRLQEHSELLDETVKYLGVDPELQAKIREHFNLLASCGHPGREGLKMMDELSPALNTLVRAQPQPRRSVDGFQHCFVLPAATFFPA